MADDQSMSVPDALRTIASQIEEGWRSGAVACIIEVDGTAHVCTFDGADPGRAVKLLMAVGSELACGRGVAH